jgi:hypothetical protein
MKYKYGISGLTSTINSINGSNNLNNNNKNYSIVRVKDIILDESHPLFKEYGEWDSIGIVFFENIEAPSTSQNTQTLLTAKPYFSNVKNYPLLNELVMVQTSPILDTQFNIASKSYFYYPPLNIWNNSHHNAFPDFIISTQTPQYQNKNYLQTQAGSNSIVSDKETSIKLGEYFEEKPNINPLRPFEGDIIYEGRWGNSIRLGSTNKLNLNSWSNNNKKGDPILIIKNGQYETPNGWENIIEDINKDKSSIYLTSTQNIPINPSSPIKSSNPNNYNNPQIIINSDRILINSKKENTILSAQKSIELSSNENVEINSNNTLINSKKTFIGENANESLLLGDSHTELMKALISNLTEFMSICSNLTYGQAGTPITPLNIISQELITVLNNIYNNLDSTKSKNNFTN